MTCWLGFGNTTVVKAGAISFNKFKGVWFCFKLSTLQYRYRPNYSSQAYQWETQHSTAISQTPTSKFVLSSQSQFRGQSQPEQGPCDCSCNCGSQPHFQCLYVPSVVASKALKSPCQAPFVFYLLFTFPNGCRLNQTDMFDWSGLLPLNVFLMEGYYVLI